MSIITNRDNFANSLQVSKIITPVLDGNGEFNPGFKFLVKNVTTSAITNVSVKPAGQKNYITTTIFPGWNPEILSAINSTLTGLQIGY